MGRKYKRIFDQIISRENMHLAYLKTRRGKRASNSYLQFKEYALLNLADLRDEIASGAYELGEYRDFMIYDPKPRMISALPFRDRVVQHAINNVIEPIFDRAMLPYTFACRPGKGTHAGIKHVQSSLRKGRGDHFLKIDLQKYFPSTWRPGLYKKIDKKIHCNRTLDLMESIVPRTGTGIKIGSLSSQLHANVNGTYIDDLVHHHIKPGAWARYMDDVVLIDSDPAKLRGAKEQIESHVADTMRMTFSRWSMGNISRGINFLGYRIWPNHKLLRRQSVVKARRKIKSMSERGAIEELQRFLAAWSGHARWADVENLMNALEVTK